MIDFLRKSLFVVSKKSCALSELLGHDPIPCSEHEDMAHKGRESSKLPAVPSQDLDCFQIEDRTTGSLIVEISQIIHLSRRGADDIRFDTEIDECEYHALPIAPLPLPDPG